MSMKDSGIPGESFGQREPLTRRLRNLVRNYPKGIGIIQEFIQNADDAEARHIEIILDRRIHKSSKVPSSNFVELSGPALLILNDKKFTAQDFESIQEIGESSKTKEGTKTGRFGLGFNVAYNVTDYPILLSGNRLAFFDPHGHIIPDGGTSIGIDQKIWQEYPDLLRPFTIAGLKEKSLEFKGTAFRLPLRTHSQAEKSEIRKETFSEEDFDKLIVELLSPGSEILLFLKNVLSISVSNIAKEDPFHKETIARIETVNANDVIKSRNNINRVVKGDNSRLLKKLKRTGSHLPTVIFRHSARVIYRGKERPENWKIISGLYVDPDGLILNVAGKLCEDGEKVVPWVGVACRLRQKGDLKFAPQKTKGRAYCFLPFAKAAKLPVHVNGFFDLDDSRVNLTSNESLLGKDGLRTQWNRLLIEHALAKAYADLISEFPSDNISLPGKEFYSIWPKTTRNPSGPLGELAKHVYRHLEEKSVIRSACPSRWLPIGQVYIVPSKGKRVEKPLAVDGMSIPKSPLPVKITEGFKAAKVKMKWFTPQDVCDRFRMEDDIDTVLENTERLCLARRDWVKELLRFCNSGGQRLLGLPFAILSDGKLHTFGYSAVGQYGYNTPGVIFLADPVQREIFQKFPEWFLDEEFQRDCNLEADEEAGLLVMTGKHVAERLETILAPENGEDTLPWDPNSPDPPNAAWLILLFRYLANLKTGGYSLPDEMLKNLPLIPDESGKLIKPGICRTPLFCPRDHELKEKLLPALGRFNVSLVGGGPDLEACFQELLGSFFEKLVWPLGGGILIQVLARNINNWQEEVQNYDPIIHDVLLDFLMASPIKDIIFEKRKGPLREMPLFPTQAKEIVCLNDKNVYFPADFAPPPFVGDIHLLKTGKGQSLEQLYKKLDVEPLNLVTFLREILLDGYSAMASEQQLESLQWIRDNLSKARSKISEVDEDELMTHLRTVPLVRCTDGELRPIPHIYDPNSEISQKVLKDRAPSPDMELYKPNQNHWLEFFRNMGMLDKPRVDDLLSYVEQLMKIAEKDGTDAVSGLLNEVLVYLSANWDDLFHCESNRQAAVGYPGDTLLVTELRNRAWLPAQRSGKILAAYAAATIPGDKLYRPAEIYPPRLGHLVASQSPIASFKEPQKNLQGALFFRKKPPLETVIRHFDRILTTWEEKDHGGLEAETLQCSVSEIYRFFGNILKNQNNPDKSDSDIEQERKKLNSLREKFESRPCLWDKQGGKFWAPSKVFRTSVDFFNPKRVRIEVNPTESLGYEALGRKENPRIEDYVEVLEEISNDLSGGHQSSFDTNGVLDILRRLDLLLVDSKDLSRPVKILTEDGCLVPASDVYRNDDPWLKDKIWKGKIHILHKQVPPSLAEKLKVERLRNCICENLLQEPKLKEGGALSEWCERIQQTMRSYEFCMGLKRLFYQWDKMWEPRVAEMLQTIKIVPATRIETKCYMRQNTKSVEVGGGPTSHFFWREENQILLKVASNEIAKYFVAECLCIGFGWSNSVNTAPLMAILDSEPESINSTLNDLRVRDNEYEPAGDIEISGAGEVNGPENEIVDDPLEPFLPESDDQDGVAVEPGGTKNVPVDGTYPLGRQAPTPTGEPDTRINMPPKKQSGEQRRLLTYVCNEKHPDSFPQDQTGKDRDENLITGNAAVDRVLEYEKRHGRAAERKGHYNHGFDVIIESKDGADVRYIEVKGIKGEWGAAGVSVSATQFNLAQEKQDAFWLYVVEHAREKEKAEIYTIKNPVPRITNYLFDSGWKWLSENTSPKDPEEGDTIKLVDGQVVTVLKKHKRGRFNRICVRFKGGVVRDIPYSPTKMTIIPQKKG